MKLEIHKIKGMLRKQIILIAAAIILVVQGSSGQVKNVGTDMFFAYSLYNFSKHTEWKSEQESNVIKIAVVGKSGIYNELVELTKNRKSGTKQYQINYYKKYSEITDYNHIIFLSSFQSSKIDEIKESLQNKDILFVTEREGMCKWGAGISFFVTPQGKIEFEIGWENIEANNLSMSNSIRQMAKHKI